MDVPFQVTERKDGKIDVTWRLADAKGAGLMTLNKVRKIYVIRLKFSDREKICRAVDITKSVRATADGLKTAFSFETFFSRGAIFWHPQKMIRKNYLIGHDMMVGSLKGPFNQSPIRAPYGAISLKLS